ncbi:hypothetical protein FOCG_00010 [Fusarium oxysporum f. sp. radicis-lycopersici 26381]|uniref:Major facilitator superfamily (MFS) profile domain-containing protein n=1 Tax=Fusarium oxysporum f. sp. cepae TaxID=396571 RepID=A0A3L6NUJ5_FUSOX|nr:hypothetical protein FOCG_00010 [Fusarium oxysporum f. sp. radicis-lycopersici 26381]RKK22794.1 hypothetical protein BFJ65_g5385 [Fusarium oxysporum f. sp. cepae]RKK39799.1 hypothetical protein BFJ66_g11807 [Fusarium oxysporum f. sp. cepae]RKK48407.1 hypothetical protein BFJ67_g7329 [Fusarium oxysporum f. sp. cepae]
MFGQQSWFGRGRSLRWAVSTACSMAFILFGYDQGVFAGIVGNEDWKQTFGHPSSSLEGIIVSVYNLGALSGCVVSFLTGEKLGRRASMWFAMAWIIVGAILQTTAYNVPHLIIGRYITGIGTGIETSTVPVYQSELCDAEKRGKLISSEVLCIGVGIVIAYFFDYGMARLEGDVAWRTPIACQIIFAIFVIVLVFGIPESPRWLYYHDRRSEAQQVLCEMWDADANDAHVAKQQSDILAVIELERRHGSYRWADIFKRDDVQTGRRVLLAWGMQFMNQFCGINLIVYFLPSALQYNVGLSRNMAQLLAGAVNCMFVVGALVPTFLLDRMGRRGPMLYGSLGLGVCMLLVSVLLKFQENKADHEALSQATASASVTFFFLYMTIFGATIACVPWAYVPEILPLHARGKGTSIGISSNWMWNFVVVMITPTIIDKLQWKAYLIFMCTNFAFIPLVYFCYPETTNLTLEEVDYLFVPGGPSESLFKVSKKIAKPQHSQQTQRMSSGESDSQAKEPSVAYVE